MISDVVRIHSGFVLFSEVSSRVDVSLLFSSSTTYKDLSDMSRIEGRVDTKYKISY